MATHARPRSAPPAVSPRAPVILAAAAAGAFAGAPLVAVPVAAAEVTILPETVVSASRVETPSAAVGSAVTVITGEELRRGGSRFAADALRSVPGLAVNRSGGPGAVTQVRIRGAEGNHTLVLIDGVEANDPFNGSEFDFAHLLADDIERIEIVRGPQSALWGADAVAGVVNVITRRGRPGLQASARLETGSFGTQAGAAALRGAGERYRFAFAASGLDTQGTNIARSGSETDGYRNGTLDANGALSPLPWLEIAGSVRRVDARTDNDQQDFIFGSPTQGLVVDAPSSTDVSQLYARAEGRVTLLDGAWEQVLGAGYTSTELDGETAGTFTGGNEGSKLKLDYQSTFTWETEALAPAAHTLTVLGELESEDFENRAASPTSPSNQRRDTLDRALAAEYRLALFERIFLGASARRDENQGFADETTFRLTGAVRFPDSGTRVHASLGTGVTNPNFFELFGFDPTRFVGNPDLRPEKSRGWDLGVEQSFLDGRAVIDVTWFESDLRDEITTVFVPPTFVASPVNQTGVSTRHGLEVSARARLAEGVTLRAAYTFLRAQEPDGSAEVRRPKHVASLGLDYLLPSRRGGFHLGADYNGETDDLEFVFATPETRVRLDDYVLVNAHAWYRVRDGVEAFVRVENLLDQTYEDVFGFATPGIGAFGGLRIRFDAPR